MCQCGLWIGHNQIDAEFSSRPKLCGGLNAKDCEYDKRTHTCCIVDIRSFTACRLLITSPGFVERHSQKLEGVDDQIEGGAASRHGRLSAARRGFDGTAAVGLGGGRVALRQTRILNPRYKTGGGRGEWGGALCCTALLCVRAAAAKYNLNNARRDCTTRRHQRRARQRHPSLLVSPTAHSGSRDLYFAHDLFIITMLLMF
ncbi:hypothetical protein LSTR_LSTR007796 [Laodelphax striatellus]|uniref:Uncharacterized protein n=1 Tax=Laodelphax striatellus TaxID=195883 RepID=A0A482WMK6_LAOST|nr:hypothetical protein LSTR_LSTR007796 [Laodelphax striatellus]